MNPLVDHRTIFDAWRRGPAAVIRLFEDSFGKYAVWEPPPPSQQEQTIQALLERIDQLTARISRLEDDLNKETHRSFVPHRKVQELEARLAKNSTNPKSSTVE